MEYYKRKHTRFNVGDLVRLTEPVTMLGDELFPDRVARVVEVDEDNRIYRIEAYPKPLNKWGLTFDELESVGIGIQVRSHKFDIGDTIQFKFTSDRNLINELNSLHSCGIKILMGNVAKVTGISLCTDNVIYRIKFSTIDKEVCVSKETLERLCVRLPDPKFKIGDIIVCKKEFHTWNSEITVGYTVEVVDIIDGDYVVRSLRREYGKNVPEYRSRFGKCEKFFKKLEF